MDETIPPQTSAAPTPFTAPPPPPPPPLPPPPPVFVPGGKPSGAKKSRGWMVAAIILFVLLAGSMLMNFGQLISGLGDISSGNRHHSPGPRMEEVTLEDHDASDKIAVVRIEGVITSARIDGSPFNMVDSVREQLRRATKDKHVQAVLLKVDSPGGEVLASDEIANALRDFQKNTGKPVIVSMGNLAASGGYYVSAPCRYIVANDLTITGSIGVIMSGLNYRGLMDKVGLRPQVFKSGKYKDMLSGSRDPDKIPPEEIAMVQNLINEVYGKFTNVVAKGRSAAHKENGKEGRALSEDWDQYADGRVLSGSEAFKYGFVDELGNFETAVEKTKDIAGLDSANLIEYRRIADLADLFQMFGQSNAKGVKIDLGIELPKLKAGQPYFLSADYLY